MRVAVVHTFDAPVTGSRSEAAPPHVVGWEQRGYEIGDSVTHRDDVEGADSEASPLSELNGRRVWAMIESAPDGMLMADGDGVILAVNQQVEELFGYDRADLLGRRIEVLLPERLRDVHRAHRTRYGAEPRVRAMGEALQLRARRSDGSEFPVEVSLSPLLEDDGLAVVASVRDVTERHRVNAHTRRVQAAIDAVHDGVFMFETDTLRFVYANGGASAQTGYSNAELLSMTPLHIKPDFTRSQFEELIAPLLAGDVDHLSFRTVHRQKSGTDVPVDIMLEHRRDTEVGHTADAGGDHGLLVAVVRDVTEQVAVERRLSLSEETFRTSFDNAPVGMTIARVRDGQRILEQVNVAFADMLGSSIERLIGTDVAAIVHPDDRQQGAQAVVEMVAGERDAVMVEQRYLRPDGSYIWTLMQSSVIGRSDGARVLTHVVDITDRRARLAERSRLATMEDRERIARDLHDLVIQRLFGAGMKLQAVIPEMGSERAVTRSYETIDELDTTISELRSAIFSLHRRDDARSVTEQLEFVIADSGDRLGFQPSFRVDGPLDTIAESSATEVVATLREALSNVARHAGASAVDIRVVVSATTLSLAVVDDGKGVSADITHGNGLTNMATRAAMLGGQSSLFPVESGGAELTWTIPRLQ